MGALALQTNLVPDGMIYDLAGKKKIVLDSKERLDLQRYLLEGMVLPADDNAMKSFFCLEQYLRLLWQGFMVTGRQKHIIRCAS